MLLQSLLLIATLTVLGSTLLASTLVTAKAAFHAKVMRAGESAMSDATADFIAWARTNVRDNGIDQLPVWSATPQTIGPVCIQSAPADVRQSLGDACKLYETLRWNVTGYSGVASAQTTSALESVATGLASSQNEQRVSATITVTISDPTQTIKYAIRSREMTARVFHSAPYVAVTGERDAESESGSISSAEGDTAGYTPQYRGVAEPNFSPNPSKPASDTDTVIRTTIDCANTPNNSSPDALADNANVAFSPLREYGNLSWVYEVPCKPLQRIDPATAPEGYDPPVGSVYRTQGTTTSSWSKKDENPTSFAW